MRPVKNSVVICLELGADMHMAQLMPLPLSVPADAIATQCLLLQ